MLEQESQLQQRSGSRTTIVVLGIVVLLGAAGAYYLWESAQQPQPEPELSEEARQYVAYLDLTDVTMKAEESFLEQTVVAIEGTVVNRGHKTITVVEVHCIFRDPYGIEIGRQPALIVSRKSGPLEPGETQPFRLAFDATPPEWNQVVPNLFVTQILFE